MQYLTQEIYEASKPDEVRSLYSMVNGSAERWSAAIALHNQGYKVSVPMEIWGEPAPQFLAFAANIGVKFIPALYEVAPGTIPVSLDAADYPPFHPAMVPVPVSTSPVGPLSTTPGVYGVTQYAFHDSKALYPEGAEFVAPNGEKIYFHGYLAAPFGMPAWEWETVAARAKRQAEEGTAIDNYGMRTGGAVQVRP